VLVRRWSRTTAIASRWVLRTTAGHTRPGTKSRTGCCEPPGSDPAPPPAAPWPRRGCPAGRPGRPAAPGSPRRASHRRTGRRGRAPRAGRAGPRDRTVSSVERGGHQPKRRAVSSSSPAAWAAASSSACALRRMRSPRSSGTVATRSWCHPSLSHDDTISRGCACVPGQFWAVSRTRLRSRGRPAVLSSVREPGWRVSRPVTSRTAGGPVDYAPGMRQEPGKLSLGLTSGWIWGRLSRVGSAVTLKVPRPGQRCLRGASSVDSPENAPRRPGCRHRCPGK
jgi:hypothetical protein